MKMHTQLPSKQKGFSILTGFILAIVMFGSLAFFLAGRGVNSGFGATYANTSKVSGLLASASYIGTGFDAVTLNGTAASTVTFDAATSTGIFNPITGGSSPQALDPGLFDLTTGIHGYWVYRGNDASLLDVGGIGDTDGEYTIMVSGLKLAICQQINNALYNTPLNTTPNALAKSAAQVMGSPTRTTPSVATVTANSTPVSFTSGMTLTTNSSGWMNGCYSTTDPYYVYIHTLLPQ
jgi:hypothetical protein